MLSCCDVLSAPLRLSIANIQFFVVNLHNSYHELYDSIRHIKHHQKRLKIATEDSKDKALADLGACLETFKVLYKDIQDRYADPYMEKVRVHYPELHSALLSLRIKVQNDKAITALLTKEP